MSLVSLLLFLIATQSVWANDGSPLLHLNKNRHNLNGSHLVFAAYHSPPFGQLKSLGPNGNYTYVGSDPILFDWIAKKLKFVISFMFITDKVIGQSESFVDYSLLLIANKEVDGIVSALIATPERRKTMDFTYLVWTEPYVMVVPRPGDESRLFAVIRPFQPTVWLLILVTALVMIGSMCLFSKIYSNFFTNNREVLSSLKRRRERTLVENASSFSIYIINIFTNQGGGEPVHRHSFRMFIGMWLLVAMVLVNSYSSTVISFLTVTKRKAHINTLKDLAESKEVGIILRKDTVIGQQILEAKSGVLNTLGNQARQNPDRLFTDMEKIYTRLETEQYAFPFLLTFCRFFVVNQYKKTHKCSFKITDPLPMSGYWSLALQKDSKYIAMFNDALIELWETGLLPFWVKNLVPNTSPKCFANDKQKAIAARQSPIQLKDLVGAFFVLGLGLGVATLTFLIENINGKCIHQ